jgi:hypothetical protein
VPKHKKENTQMAVDDEKREAEPDFAALRDPQELVDAYNEMVLTAVDLKLTYLSRKEFSSLQEGAEACAALHADIKSVVAKREKLEENKEVAQKSRKQVGAASARKSAANGGAPRGSGTRFPLEATIEWVGRGEGKENPYNKNKSRHAPVEVIRKSHGRSVKAYLAKEGASGNILALAVRQEYVIIQE